MEQSSITIAGIEFLSHTWPLVFGLPTLLLSMGILGGLYELFSKKQ